MSFPELFCDCIQKERFICTCFSSNKLITIANIISKEKHKGHTLFVEKLEKSFPNPNEKISDVFFRFVMSNSIIFDDQSKTLLSHENKDCRNMYLGLLLGYVIKYGKTELMTMMKRDNLISFSNHIGDSISIANYELNRFGVVLMKYKSLHFIMEHFGQKKLLFELALDIKSSNYKKKSNDENRYLRITEFLIESKIDLNYAYPDGGTIWHLFAENNYYELLLFGIKYGANINIADRKGKTVMMRCPLLLLINKTECLPKSITSSKIGIDEDGNEHVIVINCDRIRGIYKKKTKSHQMKLMNDGIMFTELQNGKWLNSFLEPSQNTLIDIPINGGKLICHSYNGKYIRLPKKTMYYNKNNNIKQLGNIYED